MSDMLLSCREITKHALSVSELFAFNDRCSWGTSRQAKAYRTFLTGDLRNYLVELSGTFADVLHRDTFVVTMNPFVLFNSGVEGGPTVRNYSELSVQLTLSITAQHLCGDDRFRMIGLTDLRNDCEEFRINGGAVGWLEGVNVFNFD